MSLKKKPVTLRAKRSGVEKLVKPVVSNVEPFSLLDPASLRFGGAGKLEE